jgi:outer membrane protein assembly factor BamB
VTDDPTEPAPGAPASAPSGRGRRPARPPSTRPRAIARPAPRPSARGRSTGPAVSPVLVAVAAVLLVGGGWWVLRGDGGGGDEARALPRPPDGDVTEVAVDLAAPVAIAVTEDVALVRDGPGGALVAVDTGSGEEVWRQDGGTGTVVVGVGGATGDDAAVVVTLEPGTGTAGDQLVGRDLSTGEVRWTTTGGDTGPFPVLTDDAVHLLTDTGNGTTASARVVDLATGAERRLAEVTLGPGGVADASLVVDDGAVIVGTGTGEVIALDPADGAERWRRTLAAGARPRVFVDFATGELSADDGVVVVTDPTGTIVGLDAGSGDDRWDPLQPADGSITIDGVRGDVLLARADELLFAVDLEEGEGLWTEELDGGATPVGATDEIVVVAGPDADRVTAFTLDRGFRAWRLDLVGVRQAVVIDDRVLLAVGSGTGSELQGLDVAGGGKIWSTPLDGSATLLAADGAVLAVGGVDGVHAWAAASGEVRWDADVGKVESWAIADRRLLTVSGTAIAVIE